MDAERIAPYLERMKIILRERRFTGDSVIGNIAGLAVRVADVARVEQCAPSDNR
jgi:hypothetical protein